VVPVAAGISAGVLAGIIIAAVVGFVCLGTGARKGYMLLKERQNMSAATTNPLYDAKALSGENPLYEAHKI
jgi:hypothetical protein